jgi:hypothetical protein
MAIDTVGGRNDRTRSKRLSSPPTRAAIAVAYAIRIGRPTGMAMFWASS